jgi:hypothetical protein
MQLQVGPKPISPLIWLHFGAPVQCWLPKTAGWFGLSVNPKCPYAINGRPAQVSLRVVGGRQSSSCPLPPCAQRAFVFDGRPVSPSEALQT